MIGEVRGFTILELLVAIAIVSVLLMLAIPSISKFVESSASQQYCNILTQLNYYLAIYRATSYPEFTYPRDVTAASVFGDKIPTDPFSGNAMTIFSVSSDNCPNSAPSSDVIVYCYNEVYSSTVGVLPTVSGYRLVISSTLDLPCPLGIGE